MENVIFWIFILVPFVSLIFLPKILFNLFAVPQGFALGLLSLVGVTLGVVQGSLSLSTPSIFIILFFLYMSTTLLWSDPIHNAKKEYGLQAPLFLLFILGATYLNQGNVKWVALSFTIVLFLESIYSFLQTKMIDPFFDNKVKGGGPKDNAIGTIGNPNFLASFLMVVIWISIYSALSFSLWLLLVPAFATYVLYKTNSKAGMLATLGSMFFFVFVSSMFDKIPLPLNTAFIQPFNSMIFNLCLFSIIFTAIMVPILFHKHWNAFWNARVEDPRKAQIWYLTLRYRLCYWWAAWELIKEKPIFGWGMWSFRKEVYRAQALIHHNKYDEFLRYDRYLTPQPREVHNDFLEHLVEFGLVGFSLFMVFLSSVFIIGFNYLAGATGIDFYLMLILLSGLVSLLIVSFFFFSLRLVPTAMAFWMLCAMITGIGTSQIVVLGVPFYIPIMAFLFLGSIFYYCIFKRFMASYYFQIARTNPSDEKRSRALEMAIAYQPSDSVLRTHAALGCVDFEPAVANMHIGKLINDFDGMTPLWVTLFNAALIKARTRNIYEEATVYLNNSHYVHPYFPPTIDMLFSADGIGVRSRYVGGPRFMVKVNEETKWKVQALQANKDNLKLQHENLELKRTEQHEKIEKMKKTTGVKKRKRENSELKLQITVLELEKIGLAAQLLDANMINTLLNEKRRLTIPDTWMYDNAEGFFVTPEEAQNRGLIPESRIPDSEETPYPLEAKDRPKKVG